MASGLQLENNVRKIPGNVFSHNSLSSSKRKRETVEQVSRSQPMKVENYHQLVEAVAEISYRNRDYFPVYRGQTKEYWTTTKLQPKSKIIPSIQRPASGSKVVSSKLKTARQRALYDACNDLATMIKSNETLKHNFIAADFRNHEELCWSIFQHYKILPTPMLDVTQSLHVACSFASNGNSSRSAIVYMLGLEEVSPTIFYSYFTGHQLIRLLSVMPKTASRPFYQEGYMLAAFPQKLCFEAVNYSARMLAKFEFDPDNFWPTNLPAIPNDVLYPSSDKLDQALGEMREKYSHLW